MSTLRTILGKSNVQAILALAFGVVTCWGFAAGKISGESFMQLVGIIIAFYFGAAAALTKP